MICIVCGQSTFHSCGINSIGQIKPDRMTLPALTQMTAHFQAAQWGSMLQIRIQLWEWCSAHCFHTAGWHPCTKDRESQHLISRWKQALQLLLSLHAYNLKGGREACGKAAGSFTRSLVMVYYPEVLNKIATLGSASVLPFSRKENSKHIPVNASVQRQFCGKITTYWPKASKILKLKAIKLFACLQGNIHFCKHFFWVTGKDAFE